MHAAYVILNGDATMRLVLSILLNYKMRKIISNAIYIISIYIFSPFIYIFNVYMLRKYPVISSICSSGSLRKRQSSQNIYISL